MYAPFFFIIHANVQSRERGIMDTTTIVLISIIVLGIFYIIVSKGRTLDVSRQIPQSNESLMNRLFKWKKQAEYNGVTFYVRIVSDMVIEDARKYALLASRKLRRDLRDPNSDAFFMHLDVFEEYDIEQLIGFIEVSGARQVMQDFINNNPKRVIESLHDNPSQEEIEQYEEAKEFRDKEYADTVTGVIDDWRKDFDAQLRQRSREELLILARRYEIDRVCENLFRQEFESYVVAASVYRDSGYKERMFTVEEYKSLPTEVKNLLYATYNEINIGADEIKNS